VRAELACTQDPNADTDGDGFSCSLDCNEGDPTVHFGAAEVCSDHVDQDCNGRLDDAADCPDCVEDAGAGRPLLYEALCVHAGIAAIKHRSSLVVTS
jgi:hypothetical protein